MSRLKLNKSEKDYRFYGLRENPFTYSGVPDEEPQVYCDQEEVIKALNNVLSSTISTGKSNHLVITGTYGNGKSHTLKYIKSEVKRQFPENGSPRVCVGYVSQPGTSFLDIYREFIYDLGYDFIKRKSEEYLGLTAYKLSNEGKIKTKVNRNNGWEKIESGDILISDVVPTAVRNLNETIRFIDFTRAFLNVSYEDNSIYSWEWLSGEGVDYIKRREMGVSKNLDASNSLKAFIALKKLLNELGYSTVILLIDEFETVETLNTAMKQRLLNNLRHLIDMNPTGLSITIACAPEVWQTILSEYHAFSERIVNEANLKPMNQDKMILLIIEYLSKKRVDGTKGIDPFTDKSISKIYQLSKGNARRIISICSRVLDEALERGKKKIDDECFSWIS